jgi:hypothetical protein
LVCLPSPDGADTIKADIIWAIRWWSFIAEFIHLW